MNQGILRSRRKWRRKAVYVSYIEIISSDKKMFKVEIIHPRKEDEMFASVEKSCKMYPDAHVTLDALFQDPDIFEHSRRNRVGICCMKPFVSN
ncbi:hypothetical protein HBH53_064170 [Parastagonospora nodorum]|nr:hypothetical protein HBH53_064170 [Parastagonospora nodorum]KAH5449966.1 hypothetical protein HBI30_143630 [Parastagonospora nodorum]KAH6202958.1 hypothetical protein HBI43_209590 [Parastagonospora nodorum]KAH6243985.1 hypothetical protein HBI42_210350 [Parastagonospora nodorum]KAH6484135.1 hypothetical protein HBI58_065080 [Parastagonospora nodorum]